MVIGCTSNLPLETTISRPYPYSIPKQSTRKLTVSIGFRPPSQRNLAPNDLETYNVRNDGWCLVTLALILIGLTNAVPFSPESAKKFSAVPYAKAIVAATIFHHVATGIGAYQHYKLPSHYNTSMGIGVWGNVWLSLTGLLTLVMLQSDAGDMPVEQAAKKVK